MLRLRSLSLRVVQRHTAASISRRPWSTGQHWFTTGPPTPMCTSPPSRSTHAPSFTVSMGQVACHAGGGGGRTTGGFTMGGTVIGPLGFLLGLCFFLQWPQERTGVTEEMNSMQMKSKAKIFEDSMVNSFWISLPVSDGDRERQSSKGSVEEGYINSN